MIVPQRRKRPAAVLALLALALLLPAPRVFSAQAAEPNPIVDVTLLAKPVEGLNTLFEIQVTLIRPVPELELVLYGAAGQAGETEIERFRTADRRPGSPKVKAGAAPPGSLVDLELGEEELRLELVRALPLDRYRVEVVAGSETATSGIRDTREFPKILLRRARYLKTGGPPAWSGLVKAGGEAVVPHVRVVGAEPAELGEVGGARHLRLSFKLTGAGDPAGYVFLVFGGGDRFWTRESPEPAVDWEVSALEPGHEYFWLARARSSKILLRFNALPSFRLASPPDVGSDR